MVQQWSHITSFGRACLALALTGGLGFGCSGGAQFEGLPSDNPPPVVTPIPDNLVSVTDPFTQPSQGGAGLPVDIIFIGDTSGSLNTERNVLADNVGRLLDPIKAQNLHDYRVALMPAHSASGYAGRPFAVSGRKAVLYESLFNATTNACGNILKRDPFEQLKCEFRANIVDLRGSDSVVNDVQGVVDELAMPRAPLFAAADPFPLIHADGVERTFVDPFAPPDALDSDDTFITQGELGLRALEMAVVDRLTENQERLAGGVDQAIFREGATWNVIWYSDENDQCVKEAFRSADGLWHTQTSGSGQWYQSGWDDRSSSSDGIRKGFWREAYANRDLCTSSFDGGRATPQKLVSGLQQLRGTAPFSLHALGYFDLPDYTPASESQYDHESFAIGYWETVERVNGKLVDLGDTAKYGDALAAIGQDVASGAQLKKAFCLSHEPYDPAKLKCYVDGTEVGRYYFTNEKGCPETGHHASVWLYSAGTFESVITCSYQYLAD